jgi:hypothetical protein
MPSLPNLSLAKQNTWTKMPPKQQGTEPAK